MCGFFNRNCLELQKFLPLTQSLLVFASRSYGNLSSWHWNPELGASCEVGVPCSWDIPPEFSSTTHGCGSHLFCFSVSLPLLPVWMDMVSLNYVAVGLPFDSISDSSKWWLFYNLVVILMWLCKEVSCVFLWLHLDQKSPNLYSWIWVFTPLCWKSIGLKLI